MASKLKVALQGNPSPTSSLRPLSKLRVARSSNWDPHGLPCQRSTKLRNRSRCFAHFFSLLNFFTILLPTVSFPRQNTRRPGEYQRQRLIAPQTNQSRSFHPTRLLKCYRQSLPVPCPAMLSRQRFRAACHQADHVIGEQGHRSQPQHALKVFDAV